MCLAIVPMLRCWVQQWKRNRLIGGFGLLVLTQVAAVVRQVWLILRRLPLVVQHHRLHRMSVQEPRVVPVRGVERFRSLLM